MWTERKRGSKDTNSETVDVIYGSSLTGKAMESLLLFEEETDGDGWVPRKDVQQAVPRRWTTNRGSKAQYPLTMTLHL